MSSSKSYQEDNGEASSQSSLFLLAIKLNLGPREPKQEESGMLNPERVHRGWKLWAWQAANGQRDIQA